jgi:predicted nuclease of predicted toxin-antitoxin system
MQLQNKGVDIIHCGEVKLSDADDLTHLEYAIAEGRIMVSCDEDFERFHAERQAAGETHTGIVYFRMKDQCQSISVIVNEVLFLHEAADYEADLYNKIWRAQG